MRSDHAAIYQEIIKQSPSPSSSPSPSASTGNIFNFPTAKTQKRIAANWTIPTKSSNTSNKCTKKKFVVLFVSILFVCFGITTFIAVFMHFEYAVNYCNSVINERDSILGKLEYSNDTSYDVDSLVNKSTEFRLLPLSLIKVLHRSGFKEIKVLHELS